MRSNDPSPARAAEMIKRLDDAAVSPLNAYWLSVVGERSEYARQLQPMLSAHGLGVLIIRNGGFTNANALMVDLVRLLEENRTAFLAAVEQRPGDTGRIGIVLLARGELGLGQVSSPVTLPSWVPEVGGLEIMCFITDISRRIEVPLDAAEVDCAQVNDALFAVEQALQRRLREVYRRCPGDLQRLARRLQRQSDPSWGCVLQNAEHELRVGVLSPQSYRPSSGSIVARLSRLKSATPPAKFVMVQPDLIAALGITESLLPQEGWEGLMAALARGPRESPSAADRFCRTIWSTVPAANQFVNCVAHADFYPAFPVNLLTAVVDDLYKTLRTIETSLIHLSDSGAARAVS